MPISDLMNTLLRLIVVAFISTVSLSSSSWADTTIVSDSEAAQHIGEKVTVEGVVTTVSESKRGVAIFINSFIGWIPACFPLAKDSTLLALQGKKVKITGRIELYRGKPEIKILSKDQLVSE
jgi:DNA/RNA endonuclease YhcR with UshA esterase domain